MKNFILQSLDGKINLSAKKGSAVGTFTQTQTEKPNQFANELSQLMETTSSYNVSEIESLQNEKLNTFPTLPDSKIADSDTKQQKNQLLKAFENRNILLNNDSELSEILSPQSKQNVLTSDQSLFVDNIGYKVITEDGKNDKLESVLKSEISIEGNGQLTVNVSENIILSAMAQQLPTYIVTKQNPEPQDYKQLDTKMEDKIKHLISNQNMIKTNNSALSISPAQNTTINDQIKPVITDQNSIHIETKAESLTDNNVPIISTIPTIQKELLKANDEKIIPNEKSMLQDEGKSQFQSEQNIGLNIQIKPIKSSDTIANLNQEKIANKITDKISSDIPTPEKVLLTSQAIKLKQDTIQKPIDSVKSTINPGNSQLFTSNKPDNTSLYVSADIPEINELPNIKQSESRQVIGSFQRSQVTTSNNLESSYIKETESGEHTNDFQFDTPIITPDKENKPIEQYEFRQNINPVQNPNAQIKLSPKQVYDKTPEIYNPADISALKASITGFENSSASAIKQAELNGNDVSVEYAQVKTEQNPIKHEQYAELTQKSPILIKSESKQNSQKTSEGVNIINESSQFSDQIKNDNSLENVSYTKSNKIDIPVNLTKDSREQILPQVKQEQNTQAGLHINGNADQKLSSDKPIEQYEFRQNINPVQNPNAQIKLSPKQVYDRTPEIYNPADISALKASITGFENNSASAIKQAELNGNDVSVEYAQVKTEQNPIKHEQYAELTQKSPILIKSESKQNSQKTSEGVNIINESSQFSDQIKNDNSLENVSYTKSNKIDIPVNLTKDSREQILPQVKQEQNTQADLHINGNADQKLSSDKPILTEKTIDKPATNLPKKSLENVIINNVNDNYEKDVLPPTSDKKTSESKSDINQTFKTQIITNGLLFNKSGFQSDNKNTQDQQKSMINQTQAKDNQAQKANNQKDFSVELDETRKYSTEKPNSPKLMENQNVKMDKGQQDNYIQEKPVQISSNSIVEQDKSSKSSIPKNSENNPYTTVSDTISKQDTKGSTFQETQQIGYERRLNTEDNIQRSKVDNIESNNFLTKDDVMKDKSSEIISPKIEKVQEANTDKTSEKFDIPLSRVNNDFVTTQKTDVKNTPVIDKNEMTSKVVELPDKITQYISTVKNDTKPQSVTIQLEPANLGKIKLKVSVKDNKLMAEMSVASFATKQIIEAQLPDIKRSLMQYDLQVSGFNVTLDNGSSKFGSYNPNSSQQGKWSSETWNNNRGDENNNNSHENTKRYIRYVNNESMVDILT